MGWPVYPASCLDLSSAVPFMQPGRLLGRTVRAPRPGLGHPWGPHWAGKPAQASSLKEAPRSMPPRAELPWPAWCPTPRCTLLQHGVCPPLSGLVLVGTFHAPPVGCGSEQGSLHQWGLVWAGGDEERETPPRLWTLVPALHWTRKDQGPHPPHSRAACPRGHVPLP